MYVCQRDTFVNGRYYKAGETAPKKLNDHFKRVAAPKPPAPPAPPAPPDAGGEGDNGASGKDGDGNGKP